MDDFNRVMGDNNSTRTAFGTLEASLNKIDDLDARAMWKREFADFDVHNVRYNFLLFIIRSKSYRFLGMHLCTR